MPIRVHAHMNGFLAIHLTAETGLTILLVAGRGFEPLTTSLWGLSADRCIIPQCIPAFIEVQGSSFCSSLNVTLFSYSSEKKVEKRMSTYLAEKRRLIFTVPNH